MATIYVSRVLFKASNGLFSFQDGDLVSGRIMVDGAWDRVQGMSVNNTSTTGFIQTNYTVTLNFEILQRATAAFFDFIKTWEFPVSVTCQIAKTTSGTNFTLGNYLQLSDVVAPSEGFDAPSQSQAATQSFTFFAGDYAVQSG